MANKRVSCRAYVSKDIMSDPEELFMAAFTRMQNAVYTQNSVGKKKGDHMVSYTQRKEFLSGWLKMAKGGSSDKEKISYIKGWISIMDIEKHPGKNRKNNRGEVAPGDPVDNANDLDDVEGKDGDVINAQENKS